MSSGDQSQFEAGQGAPWQRRSEPASAEPNQGRPWAESWAWAHSEAQREASGDARTAGQLPPPQRRAVSRALARRHTTEALAALPAAWTVLHDRLTGPGGTALEHVVIGPAGVFVIVTGHGWIPAADDAAAPGDWPEETEAALASGADAALSLLELVGTDTGDVQGVLCASAAGNAGRERGVLVCPPAALVRLLTSLPRLLDDTRAADLAFRLDFDLPTAGPRPVPPPVAPVGWWRSTSAGPAAGAAGDPSPLLDDRPVDPVLPAARRIAPVPAPFPAAPSPAASTTPGHSRRRDDRESLLQRGRDHERSQRARRARRIARLLLIVVVLVTFAPTAAAVLSAAFTRYAVSQGPALPAPVPSTGGDAGR